MRLQKGLSSAMRGSGVGAGEGSGLVPRPTCYRVLPASGGQARPGRLPSTRAESAPPAPAHQPRSPSQESNSLRRVTAEPLLGLCWHYVWHYLVGERPLSFARFLNVAQQ